MRVVTIGRILYSPRGKYLIMRAGIEGPLSWDGERRDGQEGSLLYGRLTQSLEVRRLGRIRLRRAGCTHRLASLPGHDVHCSRSGSYFQRRIADIGRAVIDDFRGTGGEVVVM